MDKHQNNLRNLLNPDTHPFPDTAPLPRYLNPFIDIGVDIIPVVIFNPLYPNMKMQVALHMLLEAERSGKLKGIHTLVEATSGNTGLGLGILAPYFGIKKVVTVAAKDIAPGKWEQLRIAGVRVEPPEEDPEDHAKDLTPIQTAEKWGKRPGWRNLNQYANSSNWQAHYKWTGPHVWKQTQGKITVFCAGLGTTGTIIGTGKFLKEKSSRVNIVGVALAPGEPVPGIRDENGLKQIRFDWRSSIDHLIHMDRKSSYRGSRQLFLGSGMFGPSSGLAYEGAKKFISDMEGLNKLDKLRNSEGRVVVAFPCADTLIPYMEKYSAILDPNDFDSLNPARV